MWKMLAKRYKGIDSKYLSFKLLNEPIYEPTTEKEYMELLGPSAKAIIAADKNRLIFADMHFLGNITGEEMAKLGVALCYHHYDPGTFCVADEKDAYDEKYMHSVKWPYKLTEEDAKRYNLEKGTLIDAEKALDLAMPACVSLNDVKATADKYGVGLMVGEFGYYGSEGSPYKYTDKTMTAYLEDMTSVYEKLGMPWVYGASDSLMESYPKISGAKYTKLENSLMYYNENMGTIFKKINGVPDAPKSVKAAKTAHTSLLRP